MHDMITSSDAKLKRRQELGKQVHDRMVEHLMNYGPIRELKVGDVHVIQPTNKAPMSEAMEVAMVRMPNGEWHELPVCGRAPKHEGQAVIVVNDSQFQCYAARLTPAGYVIITEPLRLYST